MRRTFEYRLYPTRIQADAFGEAFNACRRLYNACLEQRQLAYRSHGVSLSENQQAGQLKDVRAELPEYGGLYVHVERDVVRRVAYAFDAFFRRAKNGEEPGYPRFKGPDRYDSLTYIEAGNGSVKFDGNRVSLSKLASNVKVKLHRPILGTPKTATIKRKAGKWFLLLSCDDVPPDPTLKAGTGDVGIDVGLTTYATLSNGEEIQNPRFARAAAPRIRRVQRDLSRKVKGSNRRRRQRELLARVWAKVGNQRRDHAFKLARSLVERFGRIAIEDLQIKDMVEKRTSRGLNRSIMDASWGRFLHTLSSKAEEAGSVVVRVEPRGTTQTCSGCGGIVPKGLWDRTHSCPACGLVLGRDHNAARNVLERARTEPSWRESITFPVEARSPPNSLGG